VHSEADDSQIDDLQASPSGKILPFPSRPVPDWLTGPADGLGAVDPRDDVTDEAPPEALPQPVLRRPGFPAFTPEPVASAEPEPEVSAEPEAAAEVVVPAGPVRSRRVAPPGIWAPVASSVPTLRLAPTDEHEPVEDEPAGDEPVAPTSARFHALPGRDEDASRAAAAPLPLAALQEPWWVIALDSLRSSRPVQIGVAGALAALVLIACWSWPRGVGTTSLSELRSHPSRYDGRTVTVRGRVGDDVFVVGAGWAFYLVQGRDTIVTFTRTQMPKPRAVVTVKGQVSTGFLDGVPRQALFEDATTAQ
jgi:hypothetical protein